MAMVSSLVRVADIARGRGSYPIAPAPSNEEPHSGWTRPQDVFFGAAGVHAPTRQRGKRRNSEPHERPCGYQHANRWRCS